MKPQSLLIFLLLALPYNAFAHVGHTGWDSLLYSGRFEWVEASLVAGVLIFYVMTRHIKAMKKTIDKYKQQRKRRHKHQQ